MHTRIEAARYFCLKAAWLKDQGKPYGTTSAMAKYEAAETAMYVTSEAVQIHGGYGYVKEYHVERLMREAKLTQIYEGTSEIQLMIISRAIITA
jgi:alkylation response protein AidB-like acyl-CoA dehydrogenase